MEIEPKVRFEDTETAFSYKSDKQLRMSNFIFSLVNHPFISTLATGAARLGLALRLPIKGLIRSTAFSHFCGGETILESEKTIQTLARFHVGTILDFSVEGEKSENGFDETMAEILRTIEKAGTSDNIPFSVFKVTGMADTALLEKIQRGEKLTADEDLRLQKIEARVDRVCGKAHALNVPVLVDAEESWIQDPIDKMVNDMMRKYNTEKAIVFNTFQMYRRDMPSNLKEALNLATLHGYFLGVKLVRGAYMEKEGNRARKKDYPNPIHPTKEATDKAFNKGLTFCLENKLKTELMCGSHNEYSTKFLTVLMEKHGLQKGDRRVWFAQLLGMSDHISFNLARAGYNVVKYVPYGPVEAVMPYLIRRAQENTSVEGQSGRELTLIRKELRRRAESRKMM